MLRVLGALFERCLELEDGEENCLSFLDIVLHHETALSWFLREDAEHSDSFSAMQEYSYFLLDIITSVLQVGACYFQNTYV